MQKHRFSIKVNCNLSDKNSKKDTYEDFGVVLLPDGYTDNGTPTRLVINCHGAGGTVTTDDAQVEHQTLTHYLLANGYAVMDVNGLPSEYAKQNGIDLRNNIGSPIAIRCYKAAYDYCIQNFNLKSEVFVHGGSMGGISSTNLVLSGTIPVIAHTTFCPVLDTYNQIFLHPWSDGLPKFALGKIYGLDVDENGEYIYEEEKILGCNPSKNDKAKNYPVPLSVWQCEDDEVVSIEFTKKFIEKIVSNNNIACLHTFPGGGHEPQLYGDFIKNPCGNIIFEQTKLVITPAVEGAFKWIVQFDYV